MTWTPDVIIGLAANVATTIIASALLLLVLWQGVRRADNWLFAGLMLLFAGASGIGAFSFFAQPLDFHPRTLIYVTTTLYGIAVVLMFVTSARIARIPTRATVLLAVLGMVMLAYLLPQLIKHRIYTDFEPADNGANYYYSLASTGLPGLVILGLYQLLSTVTLYKQSPPHARELWLAPGVMLVAMLLFLVPLFDQFPKNAVAIGISSLIMARVVLKAQLFNPLAELNSQLEEANSQLESTNKQLTDANAQLAAANKLKSQFLATMSHELRTPLNSIIGYTELVLEGTYGTLTEIQADRLQKVVRNGHNLLSLINDVLDLSKIEAGRLELAISPLNIEEIIDNVLNSFDPSIDNKKLVIVRDYEGLPRTMADPGRARQILANLVSNAIKFTQEGSITVHGQTNKAAGTVQISVTDTGIGIDEQDLPYIFDEFRQVDSTTTRRYEGTGLGLAITKRLVELQGGTIWVKSAPDEGSTFTFTLPMGEPVVDGESYRDSLHDTPPHGIRGPVAVVIDDSPEAVDLLRDTLSSGGYHVLAAYSGKDGVDLVQRTRPDIVTLDVMMPGMSGWEVLEILKSNPDTEHIPVVIVSIIESKPVSLSVAPDGHLTKPIDRVRLLRLLRQLHEQGTTSRPILVVDDSPEDREILCTVLEMEHYPVIPIAGGQQAIDWLRTNSPALVLLDLMMPDVSGFEVLHFIRETSSQPQVPVIVISAKDLTNQERAFLQSRLAELIQKPGMHAQELLQRVQLALTSPH